MHNLEAIRIVLVEPTHPGNIGAVARSMKTMGLVELVLVQPKKYPHPEASKRAVSAEDVLNNALVVDDVCAAIDGCSLVLGTSVRDREISWPTADPRQTADTIINHIAGGAAKHKPRVAILFGRESSGLSNAELDICEAQIRVPTDKDCSSLNLASAVQIIAYELRMRALDSKSEITQYPEKNKLTAHQLRQQPATAKQRIDYIEHLHKVLVELEFIHSKRPTMLMRKLIRLYNKAQLTVEEVQILRGILAAMETQMQRSSDSN